MINNDVLRSVRYMLNVSDARMSEIIGLADGSVTREDMSAFLKREDEEGFRECPDEVMGRFLNGLVILRRGRDESRPQQSLDLPLSNNTVL
ncbi:MAG: DUF1456 family protein, partial [Polyangiaceae bacterium]|nr:DUF1456 family protein [Polyangiaceae bacterium]